MSPATNPRRAAAALLLGAALALAALAARSQDHVLVVSVDGLGASELFAGPSCLAPDSTLRALAARGAYSRGVRGVLPTITYPSHATISTGTLPLRHGVRDNGLRGIWFKERSAISGTTLWDAARAAGRTVAIVTWPSTYGAAADWLVPEDLDNYADPTQELRAGSRPAGLFDSLAAAVGAPALLPFTHAEAGAPLDQMTARFAAEVVRRHRPGLLLAHFLDYDHRMHAYPWSKPACEALGRTDAWIAHILAAYREAGILDRTTVFVVSDHGFLEVRRRVSLFALLGAAGWASIFPGVDVAGAFDVKLAGGAAAFHAGPRTAPDWPRRLERLRPGVEKAARGAVRWITPERARAFGGFPDAIFVLCAEPGYAFTVMPPTRTEVILEAGGVRGSHGYCPDEPAMNAVFIASGHGVRRAGPMPRMSMTDVAPTIASFLGAAMPAAEGRDRSGAFRLRSFRVPSAGR